MEAVVPLNPKEFCNANFNIGVPRATPVIICLNKRQCHDLFFSLCMLVESALYYSRVSLSLYNENNYWMQYVLCTTMQYLRREMESEYFCSDVGRAGVDPAPTLG